MQSQVSRTAVGPTRAVGLDLKQITRKVGITVAITGILTCTVQITGDDVQADGYDSATGNWFDWTALSALAASTTGNIDIPATAVRLNVTALTAGGAAVMCVVQSTGTSI